MDSPVDDCPHPSCSVTPQKPKTEDKLVIRREEITSKRPEKKKLERKEAAWTSDAPRTKKAALTAEPEKPKFPQPLRLPPLLPKRRQQSPVRLERLTQLHRNGHEAHTERVRKRMLGMTERMKKDKVFWRRTSSPSDIVNQWLRPFGKTTKQPSPVVIQPQPGKMLLPKHGRIHLPPIKHSLVGYRRSVRPLNICSSSRSSSTLSSTSTTSSQMEKATVKRTKSILNQIIND